MVELLFPFSFLLSFFCFQRHIDVVVNAGDVLLVDTAKWWHQTEIPTTTMEGSSGGDAGGSSGLSMSYARDIYLEEDELLGQHHGGGGGGDENDNDNDSSAGGASGAGGAGGAADRG